MTAFPSERQKTAQRLTRELQALGATVTNVLPLAEGQPLKFWVSDYKKNELLQQLKEAGHEAVFVGMSLQPDVVSYSLGLVNNFEIPIAADRQPIVDDRIRGEIVDPAKQAAQKAAVEAMYRSIYGKRR